MAARSFAFDDDRAQAFAGAVDRGGQSGRTAAHNGEIIKVSLCMGAQADFVGDGGERRLGQAHPIGKQDYRERLRLRAKRIHQTTNFGVAFGKLHVDPLMGHLIARKKITQLVRAIGPARAEHADALVRGTKRRTPVVKQVIERGIEFFFGRIPGLHEVVVDASVVDGINRSAGIGVGREQGALGEWMKFHSFGQEADAVHLRHALVGQKESNGIVAGL